MRMAYNRLALVTAFVVIETLVAAALRAGAKVGERDNEGRTPLMYAAQFSKNPQVITALLRAGGNRHMRSSEGKDGF